MQKRTIRHTIIARTLFSCLDIFRLESVQCYTQNYTCITHVLGRLMLKCVIVLFNTAHDASITHSWVTRQHIRGNSFPSNGTQNTRQFPQYLGNFNLQSCRTISIRVRGFWNPPPQVMSQHPSKSGIEDRMDTRGLCKQQGGRTATPSLEGVCSGTRPPLKEVSRPFGPEMLKRIWKMSRSLWRRSPEEF